MKTQGPQLFAFLVAVKVEKPSFRNEGADKIWNSPAKFNHKERFPPKGPKERTLKKQMIIRFRVYKQKNKLGVMKPNWDGAFRSDLG